MEGDAELIGVAAPPGAGWQGLCDVVVALEGFKSRPAVLDQQAGELGDGRHWGVLIGCRWSVPLVRETAT